MAIIRRNLTVHFQRSVKVTSTDVVAQSVEVSVIPLQDASNAAAIATYVGGVQTTSVSLLNEDNPVTFSLVPSNSPGLTGTINYRIMWRVGGVSGRTETYDFAMPDVDINFDELASIGGIIGGEVYLQQTDLGVAGRVAKLNDQGQVVDAFGIPVVNTADITALENSITTQLNTVIARDQEAMNFLLNSVESRINSAVTSSNTNLNLAVTGFNTALYNEATIRGTQINNLTDEVNALQATVFDNSTGNAASLATINGRLNKKADLNDAGVVPISQIPPEAITNWIPLPSAAARLNLVYPDQVQLGDVVLTPTGVYGLIETNPALTSSWYLLTRVQSVNGKEGSVVLNASDVGAIATGASIPQSQITGLTTALAALAPTTVTDSLQSQITAIQTDPSIVRLNSTNLIDHNLLDDSVAFVNSLNQVIKKDGTVISTGGGGSGAVFSVNGQTGVVSLSASQVGAIAVGTSLPQSQITGLTTALAGKADLSNGTVPLSQLPSIPQSQVINLGTALAAKADLSSGTVPLSQLPTLPTSQITGLSSILSNNGLTANSNAIARISALETLYVSGGGSGGGGSGTSSTTVFWNSFNLLDDVTDFTTVTLNSPFGIYSTGPTAGQWYYNRNGVPPTDAAYPVITPGGHLQLYRWNESNPPDPVYALASDLTTLSGNVTSVSLSLSSKANQADLTTLTNRVSAVEIGKASKVNGTVPLAEIPSLPQSQITGLSTTLAAKADLVNSVVPVAQIPTGIPQANITNLTTTLAAKADLVNSVVPVAQIPTGIPQANIASLSTTLAAKADLDSGNKILVTQLPSIPITQITSLSTTLAGKADLTNGVLSASQIPTSIPQSSITNLTTALAGKATLDTQTGALLTSQLPFIAVQRPQVFSSISSMLALTLNQVHIGDQCVITAGSDQGVYLLVGSNPSVVGSTGWLKFPDPANVVKGVNGNSGTILPSSSTGLITLSPSDIGAMAANASIPQSQITNLSSTLSLYATTSALNTAVSDKVNLTQVQNAINTTQIFRGRVDYAVQRFVDKDGIVRCNTGVPEPPYGTAIIDKDSTGATITAPNNALVLLTNQSSSRYNGVWKVNTTGNWTRPTDYAAGTTVFPDTVVVVNNSTSVNAIGTIGNSCYSVWQNYNSTPAVVDSTASGVNNSTSWVNIGSLAPPPNFASGNGITVSGTYPNLSFSGQVNANGPIRVDGNGFSVDLSSTTGKGVTRKYVWSGTPSSAIFDITHNLGTDTPQVTVIDNASNNAVLVGWQVPNRDPNTVRIEFGPTAWQSAYRISIQG